MTNRVTPSFSPSAVQMLQETALRRKLHSELAELGGHLRASQLKDTFTEFARKWHAHFLDALNSATTEEDVLDQFLDLLDKALRDPLSNMPLGEDALLGNDNRIYDPHSLAFFLFNAPQEKYFHSEDFSTYLHPLIFYFVRWIDSYRERPRIAFIDDSCSKLKEKNLLPEIPSERSHQETKLRERLARSRLPGRYDERITAVFRAVERTLEAHTEDALAKIERIRAEEAQVKRGLEEHIASSEKRIKALEDANEELKHDLERLEREMKLVALNERKLALAINECQLILEKAKKSSAGGFFGCLGLAALCVLATWGFGSGVVLFPVGSKGVGLQVSLAI